MCFSKCVLQAFLSDAGAGSRAEFSGFRCLPSSGIPGKFPVDFFPEMTEILQICGFILYKSWLLQNKTVPEATHLEKVQKFRENICIFLTHML